jgi:hypothetical protein
VKPPPATAPRFAGRLAAVVMLYVVAWGMVRAVTDGAHPVALSSVVLLAGGFLLARVHGRNARLRTVLAVLAAALSLIGIGGELTVHGGHLGTADVWAMAGVTCVALQLLWRGHHVVPWATMAAMSVLLWIAGGFAQIEDLGVLTTILALGVIAAAGRVLGWYSRQMQEYAGTEREALEWRVAQNAYQQAHQQRIEQTGALADAMLQRIVAADGRLDQADRDECRLLHQAIRDETRGRLLLNDAVREQVRLHRRRGAIVQLLDDGRLSALAPAALARLQDDIAEKIAPLASDRIIIRSGTQRESGEDTVTIVATSLDPVALALGADDDETVDLWHEFIPAAVR